MVLGVCRRVLRHEQDAEDAFQAAFLVLARRAGAVRESVGSYLYRVAYHLALKARAARVRRGGRERLALPRPCPEVLDEMTGRELRAALDAELARLPEKYRAPLVLCCLEGLARDEAARQLGWEPATVKSRLERGRELLRQRLVRRGLDLPAALGASVLVPSAAHAVPGALAARVLDAAAGYAAGLHPAAASGDAVALADSFLRGAAALRPRLAALLLTLGLAVAAVGPLGSGIPPAKSSDHKQPAVPAGKATHVEENDPLPAGAGARFGSVRLRHGARVSGIAFSPDGKILASCDESEHDSSVCFWDPNTGKLLRRIAVGNGGVNALAFAPDGKTLAISDRHAGDRAVCLWETATGKELLRLDARGMINRASLAFSPDGKLLATGRDGEAVVWELPSGKVRHHVKGLGEDVRVAFVNRGHTLVTGDQGDPGSQLRFWDVSTGKLRFARKLPDKGPLPGRDFFEVVSSPDGTIVATGHLSNIRMWDAVTGKELLSLPGPRTSSNRFPIYGLAFTPDGKVLFASSATGFLQRWDVATGLELGQWRYEGRDPLAVSPDGKTLATGGENNRVRVWDARTLAERIRPPGHRSAILNAALSPDGTILATAGRQSPVRLWDTATGRQTRTLPLAVSLQATAAVAFAPDGKTLAVGSGSKITRWGVDGVPRDHFILLGINNLQCLAYSPDGSLLAVGAEDGPVRLLHPITGEVVGKLAGHDHAVPGLAFSPDGRALISCGGFDKTVRCWDVAARKERWCFTAEVGQTLALAYASDGKSVAAGTSQGRYVLLDAATGRKVRTIAVTMRRNDSFPSVCFSPDGKTLAAAEGATLCLWDAATGAKRRSFRGHLGGIRTILFNPDGTALYSASADGTALRWNLKAPAAPTRVEHRPRPPARRPPGAARPVRRRIGPRFLQEHEGEVMALAIAPDGRTVASCGVEGRVAVCTLATGKPLFDVKAHRDGAFAVAYSPDGKYLFSGGADRVIRMWDLARRRQVGTLKGHQDLVSALAFAPDGRTLASGAYDGTVSLWDLPGRTLRRRFTSVKGRVTTLAFAPDGKTLAVGGVTCKNFHGFPLSHAAPVRLWDVAGGEERKAPELRGSVVAYAADGRSLLAAGLLADVPATPGARPRIATKDVITLTRAGAKPLHFPRRGHTAALTPDGQLLATARGTDLPLRDLEGGDVLSTRTDGTLSVWETATGAEVLRLGGLTTAVVAFAPDGRTLVAGTDAGLVVAWDLLLAGRSPEPKDQGVLWDRLADRDAGRAYRAGCTLALAGPKGVALLRERLRRAHVVDGGRVRQLVAQLDDANFEVRTTAARKLVALGPVVAATLRAALVGRPSAEARRRLEGILEEIEKMSRTPEGLRRRRAVRVLEQAGTPKARRLLEDLSRGAPGALLTTEAKAALKRLSSRTSGR